jgi:hypothetical protein
MQDATLLNVNTTADLQKSPVDLHIHPRSENTGFSATGDYINDDGTVFDTNQTHNDYTFDYYRFDVDSDITINISMSEQASNYEDFKVNENDNLGSI